MGHLGGGDCDRVAVDPGIRPHPPPIFPGDLEAVQPTPFDHEPTVSMREAQPDGGGVAGHCCDRRALELGLLVIVFASAQSANRSPAGIFSLGWMLPGSPVSMVMARHVLGTFAVASACASQVFGPLIVARCCEARFKCWQAHDVKREIALSELHSPVSDHRR
jgi:hypothetical protein